MSEPLRLDIGCGPNKKAGFSGVDVIAFPGVDYVFHAGRDRWPFEESTVEEAHAAHFIEHLTNFNNKWERVKFFNELWRVMKPGGKTTLVFPHWASNRYYGDPSHCEPFSEMGFYYLSSTWRKTQAPHTDAEHNPNGYTCNFEATWGYALHPQTQLRSIEAQQFAMQFYKEACQDIIATLIAKK